MKSGFYPQLVSWIELVMALMWSQRILDRSKNGDECALGFLRLAWPLLSTATPHHFLWPYYCSRGVKTLPQGWEKERKRGIFHPSNSVYWKCGVSDTLQTVCAATMHMRPNTCQNIQVCSRGPRLLSTRLPFATRNNHLPWKSSKSWRFKTIPYWKT